MHAMVWLEVSEEYVHTNISRGGQGDRDGKQPEGGELDAQRVNLHHPGLSLAAHLSRDWPLPAQQRCRGDDMPRGATDGGPTAARLLWALVGRGRCVLIWAGSRR